MCLAAPVAVDDLLHAGLESCDETDEPGTCQYEPLVAAPRPVAQTGVFFPEGEELQQCGEQDPQGGVADRAHQADDWFQVRQCCRQRHCQHRPCLLQEVMHCHANPAVNQASRRVVTLFLFSLISNSFQHYFILTC